MKVHRRFVVVALVAALCVTAGGRQAQAAGAADDHTVLILDATVSGGASSREAQAAAAAGYSVEVAGDSQWGAKSAVDFATYRALILGDATCTGLNVTTAAEANKTVWGSVINGNVILVGTDPVFHDGQGGASLSNGAVAYAGAQAGKTGAYISLSCYYHATAEMTPVPLLDPFGSFTVRGVGCYDNAHVVASNPALAGITDSTLSNWGCSVHEAFDGWPADFQPLVIARDIGSSFTASDGSVGTPYIMGRGQVTTLGLSLTPSSATNLVNTNHTVTATLTDSNRSPVTSALIGFQVTSGPNTGTTGTCNPSNCLTDASGQVTWTYLGAGGPGNDVIQAFEDTIANNMPDPGEPQTTALKTWTTCGDGTIQEGESCDPAAAPTGCSGVLSCRSDCQCGCIRDSDCDDGNACTSDTCDTSTGACSHADASPLPESCLGCCESGIAASSRAAVIGSCSDGVGQSACSGQGGTFVSNGACNPGTGVCETATCGNGIVETGEDCDPGTSALDSCCNPTTCRYEPSGTACTDDNNVCTDDQCDIVGVCQHPANSSACEDGQFCTVSDVCSDGVCQPGTPRDCGQGSACSTSSCDEANDTCVTVADPEQDGQPCNDSDACTEGTSCIGGVCSGGTTVTCDDNSTCTVDSCDPVAGCKFDIVVESPPCGSCDDGVDNDADGDVDSEDCGCSTLCAQQRFALVTTFVPSTLQRQALYCGSDVTVADSSASPPFPTGGVCTTNGAYRAGDNIGHIAATGSSMFGKGSSLTDPDVIDNGSDRALVIRQRFDSDGDLEVVKGAAPSVGSGTCSQDALQVCALDADCGAGNSCTGQLRLDTLLNPNVSRDGSAENYTRCVNALATVGAEASFIETLAGNVPGYTDGTAQIKTSGAVQTVTVTVGAGQQVMYVSRVIVTGNTVLRLVRDPLAVGPDTVLVIRVRRQLRLGGAAQVQLDGIDPANVIWNVEGVAGGRPQLKRDSEFSGTVIAANRRGVVIGGTAQVNGAIKARRIHISQGATITHAPFKPLLQ